MLDVTWDFLREKLLKEPTLLLMIVGIPNVGKSALINTLFRHAHALNNAGAISSMFRRKTAVSLRKTSVGDLVNRVHILLHQICDLLLIIVFI